MLRWSALKSSLAVLPDSHRVRWAALAVWAGGTAFWLSTDSGVRAVRPDPAVPWLVLAEPRYASTDWPGWCGPQGRAVAVEGAGASPLSSDSAAAWRVDVPGAGRSAPIVCQGRVFVTAADARQEAVWLHCYELTTGRKLWQAEVQRGELPQRSLPGEHAWSTPACDGERVYVPVVADGALLVVAVDFSGRIAWRQPAGPFSAVRGYRSSPTVAGSLVIVNVDQPASRLERWGGASYVAALHRQTGRLIWRTKRPDGESYGTPVAAQFGRQQQVIIPGRRAIRAYQLATGEELWHCRWPSDFAVGSVTCDGAHVYASSPARDGDAFCIRTDGRGDVTATHVVWRERHAATGPVAAPVIAKSELLLLGADGGLTAVSTETGALQWRRRLAGRFSTPPILAGGLLYCLSDDGKTTIVDIDRRGELRAERALGEEAVAGPASSGPWFLVRTERGLAGLVEGGAVELATPAVQPRPAW